MKTTLIELLKVQLVGKKVEHRNQHYRTVTLEVEDVKNKHHHNQITPDTRENDWWGESCDWDTIEICFVDGSTVEFNLNSEITVIN
jgi:hypothetical protein